MAPADRQQRVGGALQPDRERGETSAVTTSTTWRRGGGAPKQIPAGTSIPAGGRWVFEFASGFLNNTGTDSVRFTDPSGTQIDGYDYSISTSRTDYVFHRSGDGGAWCATLSANVTKGTANPTTCP